MDGHHRLSGRGGLVVYYYRCLFGPPNAPPLVGAHALEAFPMTVDPVERRLAPKEAYLL